MDISSQRLHYGKERKSNAIISMWEARILLCDHSYRCTLVKTGSTWTPHGERASLPVASCLTVEMRQYGDKDSAAEVLSIRNNDRLPDKSAVRTMNETYAA